MYIILGHVDPPLPRNMPIQTWYNANVAFRHVETLFIQGRNLVQNKEISEWTSVNLFDYVNSEEVLNKNSTLKE